MAEDYEQHYEFLGRMLGKLIYDGLLADIPFASFFLGKLLGQRAYLNDLASLDPELHRNLLFVKGYEGDVQDLTLTFSATVDGVGEQQEVDLVPGGRHMAVTSENRIRYVYYMADYRLNQQIRKHCAAFRRGLLDLLEPEWLYVLARVPGRQTKLLAAPASTSLGQPRATASRCNATAQEPPLIPIRPHSAIPRQLFRSLTSPA